MWECPIKPGDGWELSYFSGLAWESEKYRGSRCVTSNVTRQRTHGLLMAIFLGADGQLGLFQAALAA